MKDLLQNIEQTRILAADPNSTPEVLGMLEKSSDRLTREAVTANPNTPTDVLLRLGAEFPEQLLNNSAFSLLLPENPNFVQKIPLLTLLSILKLKNVPQYILEQVANKADFKTQLALIANSKISKAVLNQLAKSNNNYIRQCAHLHVKFAGELIEELQEKVTEEFQKVICPPLSHLFEHSDYLYSLHILAQVCPIPDVIVQYWLHKIEDIPILILCRMLAESPATGSNILKELANPASFVNQSYIVAKNPNTPEETLRNLAKNKNKFIRLQVAQNLSTPLTLLQELAKDPNYEVARMANRNILSRQKNYDFSVSKESLTSSNVLENFVQKDPHISAKNLEEMSEAQDIKIRQLVAQHPDTPVATLEKLARDENDLVRMNVAERSDLPSQILEVLMNDNSTKVKIKATKSPSLTKNAVEQILCGGGDVAALYLWCNPDFLSRNPDSRSVVINHYAKSESPFVSFVTLYQPQVSQELLQEKINSIYWFERFAISQNPSASPEMLLSLAKDSNQIVRAAAKDRLQQLLSDIEAKGLIDDYEASKNYQHFFLVITKNKISLQNIEQTRLLAADSNTDTEVLEMLEKSSDRLTREVLANNPNTPTNVLLRLGIEFPEQLLNNPAFSLLLLENINFVQKIPLLTLLSILKLKNVPQYILEQAADKADYEVQLALVNNIQTPKVVLNRLTQSQQTNIAQVARLHINFAGELTEGYQEKIKEEFLKVAGCDPSLKLGILIMCSIPEYIIQFWMQRHSSLCRRLAESPATNPNTLTLLANHNDRQIRLAVARNQNTPRDIRNKLAKAEDSIIKRLLLIVKIIKRLPFALGFYIALILYISQNAKQEPLPESIAKIIKQSMARRKELSNQSLEQLAKNKKANVRKQAMKNPNLTLDVIERILGREYALEYLKYNPDFPSRNPDSFSKVINNYAKSELLVVRFIALHQPQITQELLREKFNSVYWLERFAVSQNPNTSPEILLSLAEDSNQIVRAAAKDRLKQLQSQEEQNN